MKIAKKILFYALGILLIGIILSICFNINKESFAATRIYDYTQLDDSKYPGVKSLIQNLKNQYGDRFNFQIYETGINWSDALNMEFQGHDYSPKNLIEETSSRTGMWFCPICTEKKFDSGYNCASLDALAYMMDPRNSLNIDSVFQFKTLGVSDVTSSDISRVVQGTFLNTPSIINALTEASNNNQINGYYITSKIINEQGKNGSTLSNGQGYNGEYVGYYNLFNIGATGGSEEKVVLNGLAKAQKEGWTSIEKSIEGGSKFVAESYIAKGQNTLYLQKFDVDNTSDGLYWHQYMQNIMAAQSEGSRLKSTYESINAVNSEHTFIIPVYRNMPQTASPRPNSGEIDTSITELVRVNVISNIYLRDSPNGNKTGKLLYKDEIVTRLEKAEEKVSGTYWDKVLKANGEVGYVARQTFDYESTYKLYLVPIEENNSSGNTNNSSDLKKGDVNGDGNITSSDYVLIKNYIMGTGSLDENAKKSADYNEDGSITSSDYVLIKNYIMSN